MTNLINQITINGELTTFLNYVNPVTKGVFNNGLSSITSLLLTHFGDNRNIWTNGSQYAWAVRFPVAWETKTGTIAVPSYPNFAGVDGAGNSRITFCPFYSTAILRANSTNANTTTTVDLRARWGNYLNAPSSHQMIFAVVNNYSIAIKSFPSNTMSDTSTSSWVVYGWAKQGVYTGLQYPRNLVALSDSDRQRVTQEELTTATSLLDGNPTLSCAVSTPGANSTDVIIRDSTAPNNYIGKLWNMMVLPSSAVVGRIYKNTGIDPDTGVVETDQKAFWVCVGSFGTNKIGMRVWTENII